MTEQDEAAYTIDELAALTGVPSRTIRFYQSKCALPPPVRRGRKAYYGSAHVERLQLIARLQDRGLQIRAIRNLLEQLDAGKTSMEDWFGFEAELRSPWSEDVPELFSETQIQARLQGRPPGLLAALLKVGMVEREANQYLVRSPALLNMTLTLERNGIDVETAHEAAAILQAHLAKAARELSAYFHERLSDRLPDTSNELLATLKPIALETASIVFGREIQLALEQMLHEGQLSPGSGLASLAEPSTQEKSKS